MSKKSIFTMNTTKKIVSVYLLVTILLVASICMQVYYGYSTLIEEHTYYLLNSNTRFALELINSKYDGPWNIKGDKLYKGNTLFNENYDIVDEIKELVDAEVTILMGDTRIATTIAIDGERQVGTKASAQVIEETINKGNEYIGKADVLGIEHITKYVPLKDNSGQAIGMFFIGVPQNIIFNVIINSIYKILLMSLILVIIGTILYNVLIKINIVKPLVMTKEYLKVTALGDFTIDIPAKYLQNKDEIGEMTTALKDMQNSKKIALDLSDRSKEININSEELAATSEEISRPHRS